MAKLKTLYSEHLYTYHLISILNYLPCSLYHTFISLDELWMISLDKI